MKDNILIIGGYGKVGRIISEKLTLRFPSKVIIAGRDIKKANLLAHQLDNQAIPLQLDIQAPADSQLLNNVKLVIMCIDQKNTNFVDLCIENSVHYIDITADPITIEAIESLDKKAKLYHSTIILSVGIAPGISNLLAQQCIYEHKDTAKVNIFVLLGIGEKHGEAAFRWTFDNIHTSYSIPNSQSDKNINSFSEPLKTELLGMRTFYTFNFSDQHILAKTNKHISFLTRMAFDFKTLTFLVNLFRKIGLTKIFTFKKVQSILINVFSKTNIGSDKFAVKATAENNSQESYSCYMEGHGEGKTTAFVTVETALLILNSEQKAGVQHLHQLVKDIPIFLDKIKHYDDTIAIKYS